MYVAELMGIKITTNEFVAMMDLKSSLKSLQPHTVAVATTFLASFANFSTVGMIYGTYNSLFGGEKSSVIGKNVWKLLVSGMAVSLLSAMLVGLLYGNNFKIKDTQTKIECLLFLFSNLSITTNHIFCRS